MQYCGYYFNSYQQEMLLLLLIIQFSYLPIIKVFPEYVIFSFLFISLNPLFLPPAIFCLLRTLFSFGMLIIAFFRDI